LAVKRTVSRNRFVERVGNALAGSEALMLQKNPYLPDLLHQPNFLIVPQLGKLVAIYVLTPRQPITWVDGLASLEDLFEIKNSCGEATVAIALLFPGVPQTKLGQQVLEVLSGYFDGFAVIDDIEIEPLQRRISGLIRATAARKDLFALWQSERRRTTHNLNEFLEERYSVFVETPKRDGSSKTGVLKEIVSSLGSEIDLRIIKKYSVRSPKEALVGLPERNRFNFDLGAEFLPTGVTVPIEVASLDRYGSREKLRYLMTKARLTSYLTEGGRLLLRDQGQQPILVVSGNMGGPTHDPYRYVRALVSVGWRLVSAYTDSLRSEVYEDV
jgi:hypothetical protein